MCCLFQFIFDFFSAFFDGDAIALPFLMYIPIPNMKLCKNIVLSKCGAWL